MKTGPEERMEAQAAGALSRTLSRSSHCGPGDPRRLGGALGTVGRSTRPGLPSASPQMQPVGL